MRRNTGPDFGSCSRPPSRGETFISAEPCRRVQFLVRLLRDTKHRRSTRPHIHGFGTSFTLDTYN
jgi:hypothetical protein